MLQKPNLNLQFFVVLLCGIVIGFTAAYLLLTPQNEVVILPPPPSVHLGDTEAQAGPAVDPGAHGGKEEEFHGMENTTTADFLYEKVRLLCWVMTGPERHEAKARHVKNTWGKRCNKLIFMSSQKDESLPAVGLPVGEGRENLWAKTKEAFKYIYKNHLEEYDWFLKADDDTYVIVENLRYMLASKKTEEPVFFGCKFKVIVKQGYMSGGAGYVLSKEALKRFVEFSLTNSTVCSKGNGGAEDAELGKCLEEVNVTAGDSRDSSGRERFFPFHPEVHLIPGLVNTTAPWFLDYIYYPPKEGMECCSDNAVAFHYIGPNQMYVFEYFLYHLRPYGISYFAKIPEELLT